MNKIRRHFPENWPKTTAYLKVFLPIIFGSMFFALNGVVDNFMVGHIYKGQAALTVVNSWTNIVTGWLIGVAAGGAVVMAQFYYSKKYKTAQELARYRFWLSIAPVIILSTIAWAAPDVLIRMFYHGDVSTLEGAAIMSNAKEYLRIISAQWLLITVSFNLGNMLRELRKGKIPMLWGIGTLITNISLNAILMYGAKMGVSGAAWASVAARVVAITWGVTYFITAKIKVRFNILSLFKVSLSTRILFWKRGIYVLTVFSVIFFITTRGMLYNDAYQIKDSLGTGVDGYSIMALTGSITNIFTTTFNALAAMAAVFVGSHLGKKNFKQAKINSDELKGFNTSMAVLLAIALSIFAALLPYMTFFTKEQYDASGNITLDNVRLLVQVQRSLWVVAIFYPMWIWFSTSYRNGSAGGKGSWFAVVDWIITGPIQLGWLAAMAFGIIPQSAFMSENFWTMYAIFYLSDFLKLIIMELLYYKTNWLHSLTGKEEQGELAQAKDQSELSKRT